jgi:YidC/Oxa1 family membrane protein insertase
MLPEEARSIVFYAEDVASFTHFEAMLEELTESLDRKVCYLTSSDSDPILSRRNSNITSIYIGSGESRTTLFKKLRARVMVMTMPDLETFQIKRSEVHPVHYVYVFHSMVSTHMIYRKGAFDHFDTILCVGPHHVEEIRATEATYGLQPKNLVEHGYGRLDTILAERGKSQRDPVGKQRGPRHVLIAPSWGPEALLETCGVEVVRLLLSAGYRVTVRPHPQTQKTHPGVIPALNAEFDGFTEFTVETNIASTASLYESDVMISDWSGAALEYSFGLEKPVLFLDVPRKVNNPDYGDIGCDPLEVTIRAEIGSVVAPSSLSEIPAMIEEVCAHPSALRGRIDEARRHCVFSVGRSGAVAAQSIARLADQPPCEPNGSAVATL